MIIRTSLRHGVTAALAATVLAVMATPAASAIPADARAAPAPAPYAAPAPASSAPAPYAQLLPLVALSADRLATSDLVAAAKWGTDSPIDDPAREQVVLDSVRQQARDIGADPEATARIFRDQIEANKLVQRGLHRQWTADPAKAPVTGPDLTEVRKEINRLNTALVRAVADSTVARSVPYCVPVLAVSALRVRHEKRLDPLHTKALVRAVPSVCDGSGSGER